MASDDEVDDSYAGKFVWLVGSGSQAACSGTTNSFVRLPSSNHFNYTMQ